jgi:hypothetical protein
VTAYSPAGTRIDLVASDASSGSRTIRTGTASDQGEITWTLRPVINTTLYGQQTPEPCSDPVFGDNRAVVTVRTAVSLGAVRNGARDYSFTGRAFPAREGQVVRVYRRTDDGREVLTATTRVTPSGTWRLDRRFTGSGRFGFVARTPDDNLNAAGTSNVRPTLIY